MSTPADDAAVALEQARDLGMHAGRQNVGVAACPYDVASQQPLASAWMRSYLHWRPPAPGLIDHES
jgi:hypothetical protein